MLPMNGPDLTPPVPQQSSGHGTGPALFGGWIGGLVLGAMVLATGSGWLAALAAYAFGGALLMLVLALMPLLEVRPPQPALRPAYVRIRRRP